jgi:hypothetical protein
LEIYLLTQSILFVCLNYPMRQGLPDWHFLSSERPFLEIRDAEASVSYRNRAQDGTQRPIPCSLEDLAFGGVRRALLIGWVLLALALIGMPDRALACAPLDQTITTAVTGPVISNGGGITVDSTASITAGAQGVYAQNCSITVLGNSGLIAGGADGTGVSNAETIMTLYNTGAIKGGAGGLASPLEGAFPMPGRSPC